jgi:predicted signal transduction protein with EAL and GGDEF domain
VESPYQLTHVTEVGCDLAQGFHIGRPVPAAHLANLIQVFESSTGSREDTSENLRLLPSETDDLQGEVA